jgi:hypothetical protein
MSLHLDRCRLLSTGALSTAFLLLSAGSNGDVLRFAPEVKAELKKNFSANYDLALGEFSVLVDGQDIGEMIGTPEIELVMDVEAGFADTYLETSGGRPTKLSRRFEAGAMTMSVSAAMMGETQDDSQDAPIGLIGHEVMFTWNPENNSYDLAFAEDDSGDADLLKGLTEETDMRSVLPQEEVSVDDTWEFSIADLLMQSSTPGGDLKFEFEGAEDSAEMEAVLGPMMDQMMEVGRELMAGQGIATYKGMVEQDGARYGSIDLEFKLDNSVDVSAMLSELIQDLMAQEEDVPEDLEFDIQTATISVSIEGTGNLLWNPSTGLPKACTLDGESTLGMEFAASVSAMGDTQEFSALLSFEGPFTQALATE